MNKKLNKPYAKNIRLEAPFGLLGVPPDAPFGAGNFLRGKTVIIITDDRQLRRMLDRGKSLPQ